MVDISHLCVLMDENSQFESSPNWGIKINVVSFRKL